MLATGTDVFDEAKLQALLARIWPEVDRVKGL
jgi:hypothetical protein